MIRRLRRRHLAWSVALTVAGPLIVLAALAARPDPTRLLVSSLPGEPPPSGEDDATADPTFPLAIGWRIDPATGEVLLTARPRHPLRVADPLLYLTSSVPRPGEQRLPADAVPVGSVGSARIDMGRISRPVGPRLVALLWDNAHRRIVAVTALRASTGDAPQ